MFSKLAAWALVLVALTAIVPDLSAAPGGDAKRHSVLDYFYLLPNVDLDNASTKERSSSLKYPGAVVDVAHDYIRANLDSSPPQQVAVFRYRGTELVAVSIPDYGGDYKLFQLFRLRNGKLVDVTKKELPVPARLNNYLYELPRYGTTIRVFKFDLDKQTHHRAFDLAWSGGKFHKVAAR